MKETRFKDTEIGQIPEEWIFSKFGDVLRTFSSGATPYRGIPGNFIGNIKWITSGELNYKPINDTLEHISEEAVKNTNLTIHQAGTFLMAITGLEAVGTRGKCAFVGNPSTTNQSCLAINGTNKMITSYLFWFYRKYSDLLAFKYCQGTKQQSYTASIVRNLPIFHPKDIKEQSRIASALTSVDNLISSLDKLIEKKKNIKQGTMQQLLTGKKRLKGFSDPWVERKMETIEIKNGSILNSNEYKAGNIPVIAGGKHPAGYHSSSNRLANTITISASGANAGYISFYKQPIFASDCSTINKQKGISVEFLYYCLLLRQNEIYKCQTGGAQPHIHAKDIKDIEIPIPSAILEQKRIASIIESMDDEISSLETKKAKFEQIKQGMMQQLLTGKIRLI